MTESNVLLTTDIKGVPLFRRGKVRDVYDLGEQLLVISTDRISCFDVVLPTGIPHKGEVLTRLSLFWFELTKDIVPNHLITANVDEYPKSLAPYKDMLRNRSMLVKKAEALPVECIVRGYLSGSGWKEYQKSRTICGIQLPIGLKESSKLPEPIFTPSTKEDTGHDVNVTQEHIAKELGTDTTDKLKELSIAIYKKASAYAESHGIIIADTKFEFGVSDGKIILIDEILTPDSSRFWPMDQYKPGGAQSSYDKQFVRDYLDIIDWDKTPPAPELPDEIVERTSSKYLRIADFFLNKEALEASIDRMGKNHNI